MTTWKRTPFGYRSADGEWFLERGGRMTHGCNAWLIWRRCDGPVDTEYVYIPARTRTEVTGEQGHDDEFYLDTGVEGAWLSEAKFIVESGSIR